MDIESQPSHANRDEVIADSEEELEIEYAKSLALTTLRPNAVSSISDFTTIAHGAPSDEIVSHSIADRAKTRQRTQGTKKLPIVQDDIIELTSEDDDVEKGTRSSAQSIKPKPKANSKAKAKMVNKPEASTSHTDSIGSEQPRPRVRPRPKPIVKRAQPKLDSLPLHQYPFAHNSLDYNTPAIPLPSMLSPASYRKQSDLPIATSLATIGHAMGPEMTSQLPPSDPPNPTNTTGIGEKPSRPENDTLPPIEILQDGEFEREGDSRLLSPSSLFSDQGSRSKATKRKRGAALDIQDKEHEVDQLIPSSPHLRESTPHVAVLDAYTHGPEPPPTFFAGSSSSAVYNGERDQSPFPNMQAEVIDLTDLPLTMKPRKPKKQTVNTEAIPTEALCGDEGDSDFKPPGKKPVKKGKGKGKVKEPLIEQKENKPKEKKKTRKKKEQLDGVVLQTNKTKAKAKGKPIEKEVFKSREIIDDSDDDTDPLLLVGGMQVGDGTLLPSTTDGASSRRVSDLIQGGLSSASDRSSRSKVEEPSADAVSKEKAKSKGKKRKSIVESDEEEENEIQIKDCIVVKRRKSASGAPVSSEIEHERMDKKKKSRESVCSSKDKPESPKNIGSAGATQDETIQMNDSNVCQRTSTQKTRKENISSGPSVPSVARPLASRAASINPNSSTPLYARYEVAPRRSSLPMSELIRRASFKPGSPFSASFTPSNKDRSKGKKTDLDVDAASNTPQSSMTYSPYLKMSRRALSKIAPLHLNRRTPPPPAPAPPPKKKTKKELEREEKWEEELVESVGGIDVWISMEDSERKQMRRAKIDMEMGGYDD